MVDRLCCGQRVVWEEYCPWGSGCWQEKREGDQEEWHTGQDWLQLSWQACPSPCHALGPCQRRRVGVAGGCAEGEGLWRGWEAVKRAGEDFGTFARLNCCLNLTSAMLLCHPCALEFGAGLELESTNPRLFGCARLLTRPHLTTGLH